MEEAERITGMKAIEARQGLRREGGEDWWGRESRPCAASQHRSVWFGCPQSVQARRSSSLCAKCVFGGSTLAHWKWNCFCWTSTINCVVVKEWVQAVQSRFLRTSTSRYHCNHCSKASSLTSFNTQFAKKEEKHGGKVDSSSLNLSVFPFAHTHLLIQCFPAIQLTKTAQHNTAQQNTRACENITPTLRNPTQRTDTLAEHERQLYTHTPPHAHTHAYTHCLRACTSKQASKHDERHQEVCKRLEAQKLTMAAASVLCPQLSYLTSTLIHTQ